jgi:hypothetical protein
MFNDQTIPQGGQERRQSQEMSLKRGRPPAEVPGYDPERFLGMGAYGEVWIAVQRNTGRRVAIKFYAHRGGLDWSLLSREVEKLAFLFADRYVVQLIGVGWDADPPYYVMEYLEQGSLAERLESGPLSVHEAVGLFHDVAVGLLHAHGKGVLHCDLKPANILLDQDGKPRLADFGQSRLSHEQAPALGTLFYMAPEQADMEAVPDARWDVYALGAVLYCMLTGGPPHRSRDGARQLEETADLVQRLAHYRRMIRKAPPPAAHRQVPGVDRALAEILERCLAVDPENRYPNVQTVLDALDARAARRARRPVMVFGAIGPALLLLVLGLFAWWGFRAVLDQSREALMTRALESDKFAARSYALAKAHEMEPYFGAVERLVGSRDVLDVLRETISDPEVRPIIERLADPDLKDDVAEPLRKEFREHPQRRKLQKAFEAAIPPDLAPGKGWVSSWFIDDERGTQLVRVPEKPTIGWNWARRTYFHGGERNDDPRWRPPPGMHVERTSISSAFKSQGTTLWSVAVSTPVTDRQARGEFLGVAALTMPVADLERIPGTDQFAVLVERPTERSAGQILLHPWLDEVRGRTTGEVLDDYFEKCRVTPADLPDTPERKRDYRDPIAKDNAWPLASVDQWLAEMEPVRVDTRETRWLVVVQEPYETAIGDTLAKLWRGALGYAGAAIASMVLVVVGLWAFAIRLLNESPAGRLAVQGGSPGTERPSSSATPGGPHGARAGRRGDADAATEPSPRENAEGEGGT